MASANLIFDILAHDKASATLDGVGGSFSKLGTLAAAGALAAGAAVAGLAVYGVSQAAALEKGMNEVFTLLPDVSSEAMGKMTGDVRDFAKEMGVATDEAVPALYQAISAGVSQDNVFDFLETAQKAAVGGVTDLTTAVDGISSVVNSYGADVVSAADASDLMFTAVRLGKTDFSQLSSSLFNVIPTASALGVQFGDVTAALASMTAQGVPTSVATTQLRSLFTELSKEGTNTSKVFEEIAGKSFKDFVAEGGNTQTALQLLEQHAAATGLGINDLFGSVEAGSAALSLTGGGTEAFTSALGEMNDAAGATDAAYATMDQGLTRTLERLKIVATDVAIGFGEDLAPAIEVVTQWASEYLPPAMEKVSAALSRVGAFISGTLIPALRSFATWLGENKTWLLAVASAVGAIVAAFLVYQGVMTVVRGATLLYAGAQAVLNAVMAANPIGLIILAIVGLVAAFVYLWNNSEAFRNFWIGAWDAIKAAASAVVSWFTDTAVPWLQGAWAAITRAFSSAVSGIRGFLQGARDFMVQVFSWTPLGLIVTNWDAIVGFFRGLPASIGNAVSGLWDGIWSNFRSTLNRIIGAWNDFKLVIGGGEIAGVVLPSVTLNTPNIPYLASGGSITSGGLAIVGERGPELVNLPTGSTVYSNAQSFGAERQNVISLDGLTIYVQNPVTGEYLLGQMSSVVDTRLADVGARARYAGGN